MKHFDRVVMLLFLAGACVALLLGLLSLGKTHATPSQWVSSAGLLFTLSGVFQLEVSDLFSKLLEQYGNEGKFPFGPPSSVTREIIDNPDRPIATQVRSILFRRVRTGFWLIVVGTSLQLVAVWL